jgi:hypothetical protein
MNAIALLTKRRLRRHALEIVLFGVLIGAACAFSLTAATGARRTRPSGRRSAF